MLSYKESGLSNPVPKIILHSDQSLCLTGSRDAELLRSLTGKRDPKIIYLPSTANARRKTFEERKSYYEKLGFSSVELFEPEQLSAEDCAAIVDGADVIHLSGGEVIPFAERIRITGCEPLLKHFLQRGGVVLGVSAGAIVLGTTFKSASLFKERDGFFGLELFDFEIIPHANELFPRSEILKDFAVKNKLDIYAMNDGDILVLHGKKLRTYGAVQLLKGK